MEIFGYLGIVCIGVMLGFIGAGGSMLAIPVLIYLFSLDMVTASAYSLFLVGVTSLTGAFIKHKERQIHVRAALALGIPSIGSTFLARKGIIGWMPDVICQAGDFQLLKGDLLLFLFSLLMIASAMIMMVKSNPPAVGTRRVKLVHLLPTGVFVGVVSGAMGAGAGFLILPAMTLAGLGFKTAVGTTLLIVASNSLIGFWGHASNGSIDWYFLFILTALTLSGLILGEWCGRKVYADSWKKPVAWLYLTTGAAMLVVSLVDALHLWQGQGF